MSKHPHRNRSTPAAELAFAAIATNLTALPGVASGTGFGPSPGLRVNGKIFAILSRGTLVVKLPVARCISLVGEGRAEFWDRGQGRPLKQWVGVGWSENNEWSDLAEEALVYLAAGGVGRAEWGGRNSAVTCSAARHSPSSSNL